MFIYMKDGTKEMIFDPEQAIRLIKDQYSEDIGKYIEEYIVALQKKADYTSKAVDTDLKSYEASLDSNNACFRDLLDSLEKMTEIINSKRVNKDQALRLIDQMERDIKYQF